MNDYDRMTRGGNGSHWDGCEDVHWDCRIAHLEADNKRFQTMLGDCVELSGNLMAENRRLEACFLEFETITDDGLAARVSDIVNELDSLRAENQRLRDCVKVFLSKASIVQDRLQDEYGYYLEGVFLGICARAEGLLRTDTQEE